MQLSEAMNVIKEAIKTSEDTAVRDELNTFINELKDAVKLFDEAEKARERKRSAQRAATAAERKKLRDEMIPQWCVENLKPGMVVKVKANSAVKFRKIEAIKPSNGKWSPAELTGRHCHYARLRDPETKKIYSELRHGGYITEHVLTNVQGVVNGTDEFGRPVVTPIMDLVEGKVTLDSDK